MGILRFGILTPQNLLKGIFTIPEEEYSGTVQVKLIYQTIQRSELQRQYQSYGHLIDFWIIWHSNISTLIVLDEGCSRMVCTKLDIYVFIIIVICLILFLTIETSSKLKGQISRNFFFYKVLANLPSVFLSVGFKYMCYIYFYWNTINFHYYQVHKNKKEVKGMLWLQ